MTHNFSAEFLRQCCGVGKDQGKADRLDRGGKEEQKSWVRISKASPCYSRLSARSLPRRIAQLDFLAAHLLPRVQMLTSVFDRTQPMRIRVCMSHRVA